MLDLELPKIQIDIFRRGGKPKKGTTSTLHSLKRQKTQIWQASDLEKRPLIGIISIEGLKVHFESIGHPYKMDI
jgi:hypothetical protein